MARLEHSGAAAPTTLSADITNASLSITGANLSGYPTGSVGQFIFTIDPGLVTEERILGQSRAGNVITVAAGGRGYDGTTAVAHTAGAVIQHTFSALEADAANAHIESSTGVHGVTGAVVGTGGTQTLTGKTLTSPVLNTPSIAGGSISGTITSTGTISGGTLAGAITNSGTITGGTVNPTTLQQGGIAAVLVSGAQTLTNKTLTTPIIAQISNVGTLTLPTSTDTLVGRATTDTLSNKTLASPLFTGTVDLPAGATIGTVAAVTTTGAQTLSNKTLTSPVITGAVALAAGTTIGGGTPITASSWTTFTPGLSSFTLGTGGTITGAYKQVGSDLMEFYIDIVLGTGFSLTTSSIVTVPFSAAFNAACGAADYWDSSANNHYTGAAFIASSTIIFSCGTGRLSATIPFAWAVNDEITLFGTCRV